jgi:hypothetical protein
MKNLIYQPIELRTDLSPKRLQIIYFFIYPHYEFTRKKRPRYTYFLRLSAN